MYGLDGKIAVVTGVSNSKGIGYAIANRLAKEGCKIVITDIVPMSKIEEVAEKLRKCGAGVLAIQGDISNESDVNSLVEKALNSFGKIDIFVNNAGIIRVKDFMDHTIEDWDLLYSVMIKGTFICTKAAANQMLKQDDRGVIINMASMGGKTVFPGEVAYGTCKRAIIHMTQAAAAELSPKGIRVNGIAPGDHWTEMLEKCYREMAELEGSTIQDVIDEAEESIPLRRLGTTDDVADLCAFLVSDQAKYITGQIVNVNGGFYME